VPVGLGVLACQQADDDDDFNSPAAGTAGAAAASGGSAGAGASGAAIGGDPGEALGAGTGGTLGGAEPGAAGQAGADSDVPVGGSGPGDGACATCLEAQCGTEWQACELDEDCSACTACLDAQMDLGECVVLGLCDIAFDATSEMLLCGLNPCVSECGFD
jgi:hypothetical protein